MSDQPTDLAVHAIDHRGVDRHLLGLKSLLFVRQFPPRIRPKNLAGAEPVQILGKVVRRPHLALHRGRVVPDNPQLLQPAASLGLDRVPADAVGTTVPIDVFLRRMQRKVRCVETDIVKEGAITEFCRVFFQTADRMVGDGGRRVVAAVRFDRWQRLVVLAMTPRIEKAIVIVQRISAVEPASQRTAVDVPFARVIRTITQRTQHRWQKRRPRGPGALSARPRHARQRITPHLLGVVASQQDGPRRPATRSVVELGEPQPLGRQLIQVGRRDLAAVAAQVGEPQIIG